MAYLNTAQVAERYQCSTETVRRMCRRARDPLPHIMVGAKSSEFRIDADALGEWEQEQARKR